MSTRDFSFKPRLEFSEFAEPLANNTWLRARPSGCRFYFIGTAGHPGHVKVSDTKQESKGARAQGLELLKNGVIKKKEGKKKPHPS